MNLEWGKVMKIDSGRLLIEFTSSLNVHSIHGPVKNPVFLFQHDGLDEERSAGGSSGGSAAAVAAGMCDA